MKIKLKQEELRRLAGFIKLLYDVRERMLKEKKCL